MKKKNVLIVAAVLFFVTTIAAFAEYNQSEVKRVMRDSIQLMKSTGTAAEAKDYQAAGESLMKLAQGMILIRDYTPPRGSQADWDATMEAFINAAFKGIGACGNKDIDGLNTAISELKRLNYQGHKAHK